MYLYRNIYIYIYIYVVLQTSTAKGRKSFVVQASRGTGVLGETPSLVLKESKLLPSPGQEAPYSPSD